jgi:hypothetical protein
MTEISTEQRLASSNRQNRRPTWLYNLFNPGRAGTGGRAGRHRTAQATVPEQAVVLHLLQGMVVGLTAGPVPAGVDAGVATSLAPAGPATTSA